MLGELWDRVVGAQPAPAPWVVLLTGVVAVAVVGYGPVWRLSRGVVTIAHEGGHALAALLTGRRLRGIRLHSDTSGLTLSSGKPTGFGMVVTGAAGYIAASLLGFGYALLLAAGRSTLLLWLSVVSLGVMLLFIRNLYGVLAVTVTGVAIFAVVWFGSANAQGAFAYLFTWFLLIGGVRPVFELQRKRGRGRAPDSDADQLARLTGTGGLLWVVLFGLVALAALVFGGRLMLGPVSFDGGGLDWIRGWLPL